MTFDRGSAFLTQIFGHKVGNITFEKGVVDPKTKVADLGLLFRDPFTIRGLHIELKDKLATIKAASIVGEHKRIFKSPLTLKDIEAGPINIESSLRGCVSRCIQGCVPCLGFIPRALECVRW